MTAMKNLERIALMQVLDSLKKARNELFAIYQVNKSWKYFDLVDSLDSEISKLTNIALDLE